MLGSKKMMSWLLVLWEFSVPGMLKSKTHTQAPHWGHCGTNVKSGVALDNCRYTRDVWLQEKMTQDTISTVHSYPKSALWKEAHHFLMTPREEHHQDQGMDVSERQSSTPLKEGLSRDLCYLSDHRQAGPVAGHLTIPWTRGLMTSWWEQG